MHMADALLSPSVGATLWTGSIAAMAWCSRKLKQGADEKLIPLMGILGAFIFAAQMINFTIPATGSSGHIGGGMILAILLGPYAGFVTIASVLTIQSLFFADGGILALGANIWNLGFFPCFIVYPLIFKPLCGDRRSTRAITIASIISVVAALQMGAFSVVIETLLSGKTELPFNTFTATMLPIHLAIGLVEGFITAGVVNYVMSARPEILESAFGSRPASGFSIKNVVITLGIVTLLTGGFFSWFASSNPDGLEWSIERVTGSPELESHETGIATILEKVQEKTAFLSDYDFVSAEESEGVSNVGVSVSGMLGSVMVIAFIALFGVMMKMFRKYNA